MTIDKIRLGVLAPTNGGPQLDGPACARQLLDIAVEAERLGFDSFWAGDSLLRATVEPLTLLSHVSARTSHITIGTAALIPAYRNPVAAAQALASLDLLSAGRLVLGVGAGFPGRSDPEFALAGIPSTGRSARLDDIVALWRQLWSDTPAASFAGPVLKVDGLPDRFLTHRPGGPPIWLAAGNTNALARAGRLYDGWLPYPPTAEGYATGLARVRAAATEAGRRPPTPALFATIAVAEDAEAGRQLLRDYVQASYRAPLEYVESIQTFIAGTPEQVRAELGRFIDAGVRHVILRLPAVNPDAQHEHMLLLHDALLTASPARSASPASRLARPPLART